MRMPLHRLATFAVTFALGVGSDRAIRLASPVNRGGQTEIASPPTSDSPHPLGDLQELPKQPDNAEKISQTENVRFSGIGIVRISAHEDFGQTPRLTVTEVSSGEELLSAYFGSSAWRSDPKLGDLNPRFRFRIVRVRGFSEPLIIGIAMDPGVSDSAWEAVVIGVINGHPEQLTYESLQTSNEGGFFVGDLGQGVGLGAAQWDFVWGEDEGHPPPHQFEVKLYRWNGWRFEWYKVFRTKKKYQSGREALRAYGLHYVDIRKSFEEWSDIDTW